MAVAGVSGLLPMVFAILSTWAEKLEITRPIIRASFCKHAYVTAAYMGLFMISLLIAAIAGELLHVKDDGAAMIGAAFVVSYLWYVYAESRIFADERNTTLTKGVGLSFMAGTVYVVLVVIGVVSFDLVLSEQQASAEAHSVEVKGEQGKLPVPAPGPAQY